MLTLCKLKIVLHMLQFNTCYVQRLYHCFFVINVLLSRCMVLMESQFYEFWQNYRRQVHK